MSIQITCPSCHALQVLEEGSGPDVVCKVCGASLAPEASSGVSGFSTVADLGAAASSAAAAPARADSAPGSAVKEPGGPAVEAADIEIDDDSVGAHDTEGHTPPPLAAGEDETAAGWKEGSLLAGRFRIERFIGQGGMGKVYQAQDEILKRPIALKRIPQEILFDVDARDDLRLEANRLLDLAHESIVRIHTYYDGPTWPFFAMEFLAGPTLKDLLRMRRKEGRTFSPQEILAVARQVGAGLRHAHERGIVHRDLKPGNLMLAEPLAGEITDACAIKITDFGVSRVVADSTLRQTGKRSGTLPYMSPEQYLGEPSTAQSDIYSFACTLYELVSGKPPFYTGDIGYQILSVQPKPLSGVPRPMAEAILRGLSKEPQDRFESVQQFVEVLEGKARAPARGFTRRVLTIGSYMLVGILFVLLLLAARDALLKSTPSSAGTVFENPEGSGLVAPEDEAAAVSSGQQTEIAIHAKLLGQKLRDQIGKKPLGRPPGVQYFGKIPDRSFSFTLSEKHGFPASFLDNLVFFYYRADTPDIPEGPVTCSIQDDARIYELHRLQEGRYYLIAYYRARSGEQTGVGHEKLDVELQIDVDLTPPAFYVRATYPQQLIEAPEAFSASPGVVRYSTFDSEVILTLVSTTGVADVDTASFRRITDNLAQPEIRIDNPAAWRIALDSPGEELTFVAYAVDRAGNKSEEVKLNVIRRRLEIFPFEVVEKRGNVATVQGKLRFEGERVLEEGPDVGLDLRFMVNGTLADTAWVPAADGITSSPETVEGSAQGAIAFQATVLLGQAVNNVEVLYSWNGSKPRPFPKPVRHTNLRVDPPLILIDALPEVTNQSEISVSGHLEPYFDGLALQINTPIGFQRLPLDIAGRMAFFSRTLRLLRDQENEISFTVHYKDSQILGSSDHSYKVFCDMKSPTCQDVFLREEYADRMVLQVNASEGLSRLKGRITGGRRETGAVEPLESGALEDLAIDPVKATWEPVAYRVEVRQPYRSQSRIQLELTDLAGNTDTQEELILRAPDSLVSAAAVRRAIAEGGEGGEEPGSIQTAKASFRSGTIDFWSPFLEEMGMSFVPFGHQRLEMSEKEVPEFAWFRYLREIGESIGTPGERQVPMVLGDRPVNLVRGFVKWFEEQTDDGYAYFVPTVDQWVCAFAGRSDPVLAREEIAEWFSPDPDASRYARMGKCFTETPTPRYGLNKLQESGSRPANISPSGLLDMEANVQELVIQQEGGSLFFVIGGHEQLRTRSDFLSHCQTARRFGEDQQSLQTKFTGLRLCRRPKTEDDQPRP